jgi:hypothetical protein
MFNGIQMKHFIGIQTKLAPHWHQNTAGVRSAVLEGNISAVFTAPSPKSRWSAFCGVYWVDFITELRINFACDSTERGRKQHPRSTHVGVVYSGSV